MPSFFVLATWAVLVAWAMVLGLFAGQIVRGRVGTFAALRVSLWTGFAILVLVLLVANLVIPLKGGAAVVTVIAVTVAAVGALVVIRHRQRASRRAAESSVDAKEPSDARPWWVVVPIVALALLLLLLAHWFAAPLANYDSGLYHLNSIQFSANYPTIVGLANMHDRYGTNVSAFPLAAFMANSPWGIEAFRLLVGLFVALFSTDTVLRLLDGRRSSRRSPGLFIMLLATLMMTPFLLSAPEYWVTSPTPDTTSMLISIVAGAYLADAVVARSSAWAAMAVVTSAVAASIRTQLWVFAVLAVAALAVRWWTSRPADATRRVRAAPLTWIASAVAALLLVIMMIRDALVTGWLLFPANYLPLPVDWRVPDTTAAREWLLSWARAPGLAPEQVLGNWEWFWPWVRRTLTDWTVQGTIGMLALTAVVALAMRPTTAEREPRVRGLWAFLLVPPVGTAFVWFWTAPDPRFAWGVLALIGLIPAGVLLGRLSGRLQDSSPLVGGQAVPAVVAGLMCVAVLPLSVAGLAGIRGYVADGWELRTFSFGPIDVTAAVNPVPVPTVRDFSLLSGQVITTPEGGDQCWMQFPLCRPYPDEFMRLRGASIADGVLSGR